MFKTFLPEQELTNYVSFFYTMEKEVQDLKNQNPEFLLPSGTPIMGFHYQGNWILESLKENVLNPQVLPNYYITGQQTTGYTLIQNQKKTGILGIALKPTALWHWFKIPMHQLTNNAIKAESIILDSKLFKDFDSTHSIEDKIEVLSKFLIDLTRKSTSKKTWVDVSLEHIFKNKGCVSMDELLQITGLKERSLQIAFKKQVGIAPMQYSRILRFNNLFLEVALKKEEKDLLFLSCIYNYYDSSHLYKDFAKYIGTAPSKFTLEKYKLLEELIVDIPYLTRVQE